MATNVFFNNFQSSMEQQLIEDLVTESIRIYGMDVFYIPRTVNDRDEIYNEDSLSSYDIAVPLEMYIKNVDGFGGDGDFLSKFNIQIRDSMTFTVSRRSFFEEVQGFAKLTFERPREGDIIYFPLNKKLFVITFVEHEPVFYQMGALQMWDLKCELFEYSNERFNTGIKEVDLLTQSLDTSSSRLNIITQSKDYIVDENGFAILQKSYIDSVTDPGVDIDPLAQNEEFESAGDKFLDFTEIDPFSEGEY